MLFCNKVETGLINAAQVQTDSRAVDTGKIILGGGYRLPVRTTDAGTIRLGGGYRLPVRGA